MSIGPDSTEVKKLPHDTGENHAFCDYPHRAVSGPDSAQPDDGQTRYLCGPFGSNAPDCLNLERQHTGTLSFQERMSSMRNVARKFTDRSLHSPRQVLALGLLFT